MSYSVTLEALEALEAGELYRGDSGLPDLDMSLKVSDSEEGDAS